MDVTGPYGLAFTQDRLYCLSLASSYFFELTPIALPGIFISMFSPET
jgi:hypothetical protein